MGRNRRQQPQVDPARVTEIDREAVELQKPTRISGAPLEQGESVDVYPFERRHMVDAGLVAGGVEDIASEAEKGQGNLEVLKPLSQREGEYYALDDLWARGDATSQPEHAEEAPSEADDQQQA